MEREVGGRVVAPGERSGNASFGRAVEGLTLTRRGGVGDSLPQAMRGVGQPQVDVSMGGERVDDLQLFGGQAGSTEDREPLRQIHHTWLGRESGARRLHPLRTALDADT